MNNTIDLIAFLKEFIQLDEELIRILSEELKSQEFKKGDHIYLPDNRNQLVYFLESGLTRMYYNKEDKSITHFFFEEGQFFLSLESVLYDKSSPYGMECLENCRVIYMKYDTLTKLTQHFPQLEVIMRNVILDSLYNLSNRLKSMQFQTAEERYNELITNYPSILQRASLGYIASYLGISQPTLSVIRSKK